MKKLNPVVVILLIFSAACSFLLFQDSIVVIPAVSVSPGHETHVVSRIAPESHATETKIEATTRTAETTQELTTPTARDVEIRITGLKSQPSQVHVAVFAEATGFPKSEHSAKTTVVPATGNDVRVSVSLTDNHPAAIAVFQDLDGNGTLTKNGFGIPVEPYGFSNKARSLMGPPTFSQAKIQVSENTAAIEIETR